jgi:hypothetical protein
VLLMLQVNLSHLDIIYVCPANSNSPRAKLMYLAIIGSYNNQSMAFTSNTYVMGVRITPLTCLD